MSGIKAEPHIYRFACVLKTPKEVLLEAILLPRDRYRVWLATQTPDAQADIILIVAAYEYFTVQSPDTEFFFSNPNVGLFFKQETLEPYCAMCDAALHVDSANALMEAHVCKECQMLLCKDCLATKHLKNDCDNLAAFRKVYVLPQMKGGRRTCLLCSSKTTVMHCSQCKAACYCSKVCQRWDWPVHKAECLLISAKKAQ